MAVVISCFQSICTRLAQLLCPPVLQAFPDHGTDTQEVIGAAFLTGPLVHWIVFHYHLDHVVDLISGFDLILALIDQEWLKPILVDPGDHPLEPAGLALFMHLSTRTGRGLPAVELGDFTRVFVRVQHCAV